MFAFGTEMDSEISWNIPCGENWYINLRFVRLMLKCFTHKLSHSLPLVRHFDVTNTFLEVVHQKVCVCILWPRERAFSGKSPCVAGTYVVFIVRMALWEFVGPVAFKVLSVSMLSNNFQRRPVVSLSNARLNGKSDPFLAFKDQHAARSLHVSHQTEQTEVQLSSVWAFITVSSTPSTSSPSQPHPTTLTQHCRQHVLDSLDLSVSKWWCWVCACFSVWGAFNRFHHEEIPE